MSDEEEGPESITLTIEPNNEIYFRGPYNKPVQVQFHLRNPTDMWIAFKVKTIDPKRYQVHPANGTVEPSNAAIILLELLPIADEEVESFVKSKQMFLMQTVISRKGATVVQDIFDNVLPEDIGESKFNCLFDNPEHDKESAVFTFPSSTGKQDPKEFVSFVGVITSRNGIPRVESTAAALDNARDIEKVVVKADLDNSDYAANESGTSAKDGQSKAEEAKQNGPIDSENVQNSTRKHSDHSVSNNVPSPSNETQQQPKVSPSSTSTQTSSSQSELSTINIYFKSPPRSSSSASKLVSGSVHCLKMISRTTTKTSKLSYCGLSGSGDVEQPLDAWNSIMQLIYCTSDELRNYFINRKHQSNGPFHRAIGSTLQEMVEVSNRATERRSPHTSPTDSSQNDSELSFKCTPDNNVQTLLTTLLHGVHQESNGYVARKLAIQVESKVICTKCTTQQKSQSIEWACVIDLPSEATNDSEKEKSLEYLMEESKTEVQFLNCVCLSCAKAQASTITKSIRRSSQMFLLYLSRFKPDGKVAYPMMIDEEIKVSTKEYILSGAILYQGSSLKSGHYSTLIRETNYKWLLCYDERIGLVRTNCHAKQMLAYLACVLMYREVEIKKPIEPRQLGNSKVTGQQIVYGPAPDPNANLDEWLNISRILGVAESSNFIGPLPQNGEAYSGISPPSESFKPEPYGYCGLENFGLTCYVNSTLQALYTSTRIRHYLIEHPTSGPMHAALSKLFLRMETESARKSSSIIPSVSLNPVEFVTKLRDVKPMFGPYQMHDAQEFLTILLELIHQETNQAKKAVASPQSAQSALEAWNYHVCHIDDSYLSRMFMGQLENVLTCGRCGNASRSWMCVWQLQAQLETEESLSSVCNKVTLTNIVTLKQCLKEYTTEETLTSDCAPFCSQCKSRQPATKRQSVIRLAHYLIVHLKRFAYDGTKIHCPVSIDERLYFASATFLLSSAVCHSGTETVGHYYSLYRERDNQWVLLNDATITKHMNNKEAHELLQAYGYLFIYRAIQQDAPLDTGAGGTSSHKKTGEVPEQGVQQVTSNKDP